MVLLYFEESVFGELCHYQSLQFARGRSSIVKEHYLKTLEANDRQLVNRLDYISEKVIIKNVFVNLSIYPSNHYSSFKRPG